MRLLRTYLRNTLLQLVIIFYLYLRYNLMNRELILVYTFESICDLYHSAFFALESITVILYWIWS